MEQPAPPTRRRARSRSLDRKPFDAQLFAEPPEEEDRARINVYATSPQAATRASCRQALNSVGGVVGEPASQRMFLGKMVYVLGIDVSGKEEVCTKLAAEIGGSYLSTNVLLRDAVTSGSPDGRKLDEMIKRGKVVTASLWTQLLTTAMAQQPAPYLIDGFPRSPENMTPFEEQVGPCRLALLFEVSDELATERMAAQGKAEELIQRKLRNFATQTMPIAQALGGRSLLRKVSGADVESAAQEALKHLRAIGC